MPIVQCHRKKLRFWESSVSVIVALLVTVSSCAWTFLWVGRLFPYWVAIDVVLFGVILVPAFLKRNHEYVNWRDWYPLFGVLAFPGLHPFAIDPLPRPLIEWYLILVGGVLLLLPLVLTSESELQSTKMWAWFWSLPHHALMLIVAVLSRPESEFAI